MAGTVLPRSQSSDLILALVVVAIAAMLLVPLPPWLLDILLATNLSFSLLLLFVGLYMPNALALLSFPALLLLTTLFRLALNVASSRLILTVGEAGRVIDAFGNFLVQGEVVVGVIIFSIITIVNFVVIARGSTRVSEVAARFALDSLPGKQMAIDADLRAGLLRPEEAQRRRDDLRKESQLYGSMDGAMKFVQGDAVAGFFIIVTNIVGGLYVGIRNGLSFDDAIQTYTVLTVGDGLVTQIPALLISICAGIVVTRVSSGENTTLGTDVGNQVFQRPGTIAVAGGVLFIIGLFPGIPMLPFALVGGGFGAVAMWLARSARQPAEGDEEQLPFTPRSTMLPAPRAELELLEDARLTIVLDAQSLYRLYRQQAERHRVWWDGLQRDFLAEHGLKLPELRVVTGEHLGNARFQVLSRQVTVLDDRVLLDALYVDIAVGHAEVLGLEVLAEAPRPLGVGKGIWCPQTAATRRILEASGVRVLETFEYIGLLVAQYFVDHAEELFTLADMHALLKQIDNNHPGFMADTFRKGSVSLPRFAEVFQTLVREGIGIRDGQQLIELIAGYCASFGDLADGELDVADLVNHIRLARRQQLLGDRITDRGSLRTIQMSEGVTSAFRDGGGQRGGPQLEKRQVELLKDVGEALRARGLPPAVLVTPGEFRSAASKFLAALFTARGGGAGSSLGLPIVAMSEEELGAETVRDVVCRW